MEVIANFTLDEVSSHICQKHLNDPQDFVENILWSYKVKVGVFEGLSLVSVL